MKLKQNNIQGVDRELLLFKQQLSRQKELRNNLYLEYTNPGNAQNAPSNYEYDANDLTSNLDDSYYNVKDSSPWYERAWRGIIDPVTDSISNYGRLLELGWNKFGRTWVEQNLDEDAASAYDITQENKDLEDVQTYLNLHKRAKEILKELGDAYRINDKYKETDLLRELNDVTNRISEYDKYFTGEGRSHKVIAELMYDDSKLSFGDIMGFLNKSARSAISQNIIDPNTKWYDVPGNIIGNVLKSTFGVVTGPIADIADYLSAGGDRKYITNRYIQSLNDNVDPLSVDRAAIDKFYKGSPINRDSTISSIDLNKIDKWKDYNEKRLEEIKVDYEKDVLDLKGGNLDVFGLFNINGAFNPNIPQEYLNEQQDYMGKSILSMLTSPVKTLLYTIPEVASTVGLFKYQLGAMTADRVMMKSLEFAAKKYPAAAYLRLPALATDVAMGIGAAELSREDETALEKIQAISTRTIKDAKDNGADVGEVINRVIPQLEKIGVDTNTLDEELILKAAIAFGIPTGDDVFDKAERTARRGINTLIGANNALAIHDYIQSIPFFTYGGSAIAKGFDKAGKVISTSKYGKYLQTAKDYTIGKIADRFIKKDAPRGFLYNKHIKNWIVRREALGLAEGITEGGEEVVQEILLSRYQRGLYDNYNTDTSMFPLDGAIAAGDLVAEAIPDYLGLHPWDPELSSDDILRAFNVGFLASKMFTGVLRTASNAYSTDNDNVRSLITQLKNDRVATDLVGTYSQLLLDLQHMNFFYDALNKWGVDHSKLLKAMNDLKEGTFPETLKITKEAIDNDILMLNNLYFAMNNSEFTEMFKEEGIKKGDEKHKAFAINTAKIMTDVYKDDEKAGEKAEDLKRREEERMDAAEQMIQLMPGVREAEEDGLTGTVADESGYRMNQLRLKFPRLFLMVKYFSDRYDSAYSRASLLKNQQKIAEAIFQLRKDGLDGFLTNINIQEYLDNLYDDFDAKKAIEIYNSDKEEDKKNIRAAYKHAAQKKIKTDWMSLFEDKKTGMRAFMTNPFVREAARRNGVGMFSEAEWLASRYNDREGILNLAYDISNEVETQKEIYIRNHIALFNEASRLARTKYNKELTDRQDELLTEIQRITGLDLDTRRLRGIKAALDKLIKQLQKYEKDTLTQNGKLETSIDSFAQYFKDAPIAFDDQQEYDKTYGEYSLLKALRSVHATIATAYTMGKVNPELIEEALYNTEEDNPVSAIAREYRKRKAETSSLADEDVTQPFDALKLHDLEELSKKAAKQVILDLIHDTEVRRKIANREWEKENPITPDELEQRAEEDEREEREAPAKEEMSPETAESVGTERPSNAEKRLRNEFYGPEKSEKKKLEEAARLAEAAKRREESEEKENAEKPKEEKKAKEEEKPAPKSESPSSPEEEPEETPEEVEEESPEPEAEVLKEEPTEVPAESEKPVELPVDDPVEPMEYPVLDPMEIPVDHEQPISIENLVWNDENDTFAYIDPETGLQIPLDYDTTLQLILDATLSEINVPTQGNFDEAPSGSLTRDQKKAVLNKDDMTSLVANTFFYRDTPQIEDGKDIAPHMKVGKQELKFNKPVAHGWELAKKLVQPGWLAGTKKYFVVSDPYDGVTDRKLKGTDDRDLLTVALAIEDDKHTYLLFLLPISKSWYISNGRLETDNKESEVIDRILMYGADFSKIELVLNLEAGVVSNNNSTSYKIGYYKLAVAKVANQHLEMRYRQHKLIAGAGAKQKAQYFSDNYADAERAAREDLARFGKKIFSREAAEAEVQKMRDFRNAVIDLYTTKKDGKIIVPKTVRTDIVPNSVQLTNGRFDNVKDGENPVFRPIHDGSVEQIQEALVNGDLLIGYGLGMFANKLRRFRINNLFGKNGEAFGGKGLSGKLYWMVLAISNKETKVPVQLVEELFNTQQRIVDGKTSILRFGKNRRNSKGIVRPVLCLEKDGDGNWVNTNKEGWLPSAAEVVYLLLTRQINLGVQPDMYTDIVNMFINDNKKTLLKYQPKLQVSPVKQFLTKQLYYGSVAEDGTDEAGLHIAIDTPSGVEMRHYTNDLLINDPDVKAEVIYAIASQFHWNTDVDFMNKALQMGVMKNTAFSNLFRFMQNSYAGEITEDTELTLLGCPQLSFRVGDVAKVGKNGKVTSRKNVSYLSWMIKTLRIKTDVSKDVFYAPFVYAHGVRNENPENKKFEETAETLTGNSGEEIIQVSEAVVNMEPAVYAELGGKVVLPEGEELRANMAAIQTKLAKDNGGIRDIFLIKGLTPDEPLDEKQSMDILLKKIKNVLDDYNKKHGTSYTADGYRFPMITKGQIADDWAVGDGYVKMYLCGNGKINIVVKKNGDISDNDMVVSGVFLTKGGSGTVDVLAERRWIEETLGIPEEDIVITNAVMRSVRNVAVYGVVNTALDVITGKLSGFITMSTAGESGMGYHEAWHYVNLLMHDSATRRRIYDAYKATHKRLNKAGILYRTIEEEMADEFARDVMLDQDHTVSGVVRRFFRNIADFILFTGNRHAYRKVFNQIKAGRYKGAELNPEAIAEFQEAYERGATMESSAAIPPSITKNLKHIKHYYELLDGTEAVIRAILNIIPFATKERLSLWNGTAGIDMIIEVVDQMIDEQADEDLVGILEDLKMNPKYLMKCLLGEFKKYGIKIKADKKKEEPAKDDELLKLTEKDNDATQKEDKPDNIWDKFHLESKRKDNVSNEIKFFLSKIPKFKKIWHNNGKSSYVHDRDKFGTATFFDLDKVMRKVHQELWWIQSFGELETLPNSPYTYRRTSLLGAIERRKDSQEFYYSFWEYLQPYISGKARQSKEIRSGLFNAINSSKQHVDVLTISNPKSKKYAGSISESIGELVSASLDDGSYINMSQSDKAVADRERVWEFKNEEHINIARNITSQWSKSLASSGFTVFDEETKTVHANLTLAAQFETRFNDIKKTIAKVNGKKVTNVSLNDIKSSIIKLLNDLSIDCDTSSFGIFLYSMSGITGRELTKDEQIATLDKIVTSGDVGSIGWVINDLAGKKNKGLSKSGRQKFGRELDEMYQQYPMDSQISKLALSWNAAYPTPFEFSVTDANNNRLYPVNLNSTATDRITWMNDPENGFVDDLKQSPYSAASVLVEAADMVDPEDPSSQLQLRTFVGVRDGDSGIGGDYFGITAQEDYIAKMMMTEKDCIIFPTMADKKTWFSIFCKNIKLSHMPMLIFPDYDALELKIYEEYEKINPFSKTDPKYGGVKRKWYNEAKKWYYSLDDEDPIYRKIKLSGLDSMQSEYSTKFGFSIDYNTFEVVPRYDASTLDRFAQYFRAELDTVIGYYSESNIKAMMEDPAERVDNLCGTLDAKTGKLNCDGNGGFFRYFYDSLEDLNSFSKYKIYDANGNPINNLNHYIQALFELQKKIMSSNQDNSSSEENDQFKKVTPIQVFGKDVDQLDGFELVRDFLDTLFKNLNKPKNSQKLLDNVNQKLLNLVYEELEILCKETSPIKLGKFMADTGMYVPTGVPEQLLKPYIDEYVKAGIANEEKHIYNHNDNILANAFFSLIANHVANTAMSVIEVEKVITGDPAQFKRKVNKDDPSDNLKLSVKFNDTASVKDVDVSVINLQDTFSDKIKRLGGVLSPGSEIRPDYSEFEIEMDPTLGFTQYTNLVMEDMLTPSTYLEEIKRIFKTQLIIDHLRTLDKLYIDKVRKYIQKSLSDDKYITDEHVIDYIYSKQRFSDEAYKLLPKSSRDVIDAELDSQVHPYEDITVADAQVFIRPELYRKIRIGLGMWSFTEDSDGYSDEKAYKILEDGNGTEWMHDKQKAKIVKRFQLFPLKMSYYQNDLHTTSGGYSYMKSIYDKMAIFPLFKFTRSTETGDLLYTRMNKEGNQLDMISFKSAVKVGAPREGAAPTTITRKLAIESLKRKNSDISGYKPTKEEILEEMDVQNSLNSIGNTLDKNSNRYINYDERSVKDRTGDDLLNVEIQDLKNLRMQLNTEAHEADMRAIGTQMFKIAFSNIIDEAKYGTGKSGRNSRKGSDIKHAIINCVNALTQLGIFSVDQKFYTNGVLDSKKVTNFILEIIDNNDLGDIAREIITNGGVASGIVKRQVFENSASSFVNKNIVDIKTQGGAAIQQSIFGFVGHGNNNVGISYNDGNELKWSAKEGSMEVLLSMNFFRAVIPDYENKTFDEKREWLIEHDMINGTKKTGKKSNPNPFGIGYRIPTQGMSSMFSFIVADVLPEQSGDLIVVPREFTAQTGSDFDVDKLYIATFSYDKDGNRRSISAEEIKKINEMQKWDDSLNMEDLKKAISNELLQNYIDLISDIKNYADARASIDVITKEIHKNFLDIIRTKKSGYISGLSELTPSFLSIKKLEFGSGKSGISSFALAIPSLALTQYTHITIDFGSVGKLYGLNPLDRIYGKDKRRISAWLSAMVNAHVDVAKDPYVFDLNLNNATYNHATLLLRAGMGMSTFTFLAQPLLKYFADMLNNTGGLYGKNLDGNNQDDPQDSFKKAAIYKKVLQLYYDKLSALLSDYLLEGDYSNHMAYLKHRIDKGVKYDDSNSDKKVTRPKDDLGLKANVFDEELGKSSILAFVDNENDINQDNVEGHVRSMIFQMYCLMAYNELDIYAKDLQLLVKYSGIDTKKFGKTSYEKTDFKNNMLLFINQSSRFTLTDEKQLKKVTKGLKKKDNDELDPKEVSVRVLNYYFNSLFLSKKLSNANKYAFDILSSNLFTSTTQFNIIMRNILQNITGDPDLYDEEGRKLLLYNRMYNDASMKALYLAADNIVRFNVLNYYGPGIFEKEQKDTSGNTVMLDFTEGGDIHKAVDKYRSLLYGTKDLDSIFVRLRKLMYDIKHDTTGKYSDLGMNGQIRNDLLKFLSPLTPSKDNPIGRMTLSYSQTDNRNSDEIRLQAAFGQLLEHKDEAVRKLAEDLAFYAFYSTYDLNVKNSFFHLVPAKYRRQYDKSLAVALAKLKKGDRATIDAVRAMGGLKRSEESMSTTALYKAAADNIQSIISRNYWYDQNIVPVHYIPRILGLSGFQTSSYALKVKGETEELVGSYKMIKDIKKMVPTYIATTRENSKYLQTRDRVLYRRIGQVTRSYVSKKTGKPKVASTFYIYAVAQKAGFKNLKQQLFELFCGDLDQSIFEQAKLSKDFSESSVRTAVEEKVKKDSGGFYTLNVKWDVEEIPELYADTNTDMFVDRGDTISSENQGWVNGKLITHPNENGIDWKGQSAADVIINLTFSPLAGIPENIPEKQLEKSVNVAMNGKGLALAIKDIKEIAGDSPVVIHFTSPAKTNKQWRDMLLDDLSVKEYLDEREAWLRSSLESNPDLEEIVKRRLLEIREDPKHMDAVVKKKFGEFMDDLAVQLDAAGVQIKYLSSYMKASNTMLASGVNTIAERNPDIVEPGSSVLYIPQSYSSVKRLAIDISNLNAFRIDEDVEALKNSVDILPSKKNTSKIEKIIDKQRVEEGAASGENTETKSEPEEQPTELPIIKQAEESESNNHENCGTGGKAKKKPNFDKLKKSAAKVDDYEV